LAESHRRMTGVCEIADRERLLFLRPQHDAAGCARRDLSIGLSRLAEPEGLFDASGAVISGNEPWGQRIQHLRGRREVALERVHTEEAAFIMVEISEVKSHFTPPGCGDLNQPAAQG
jgi:hypothetical protein